MSFSPQSNCRFAGPRNQTPRADDGRKPGAAPDRRAWKQVLRNGTGSTRAAGSQYSQPLMPRFTRTCRRNVSTPGAQIIARTRTPKSIPPRDAGALGGWLQQRSGVQTQFWSVVFIGDSLLQVNQNCRGQGVDAVELS